MFDFLAEIGRFFFGGEACSLPNHPQSVLFSDVPLALSRPHHQIAVLVVAAVLVDPHHPLNAVTGAVEFLNSRVHEPVICPQKIIDSRLFGPISTNQLFRSGFFLPLRYL